MELDNFRYIITVWSFFGTNKKKCWNRDPPIPWGANYRIHQTFLRELTWIVVKIKANNFVWDFCLHDEEMAHIISPFMSVKLVQYSTN